jgi:hypothetical protein
MRVIAVLAISIFALGGSAAAEVPARDFSGDYRMAGKGSGMRDSAYAGTCRIGAAGQGYDISCFNADTRHTYVGKGLAQGDMLAIFVGDILRGDHNSVFAGEYLVLYRVHADGVLEGTWVHAGSSAVGIETLTPVR